MYFKQRANDYLEVRGGVTQLELGLSVSAWFFVEDTAAHNVWFQGINSAGNPYLGLSLSNNTAGAVNAVSNAAAVERNSVTSTRYRTNYWHHAMAVFESTTSRWSTLDGGGRGSDTNSSAPTGMNTMSIGALRINSGTISGPMRGSLSDIVVWRKALLDHQVELLATGMPPWMIEPKDIIGFWTLEQKGARQLNLLGPHWPMEANLGGVPQLSQRCPRLKYSARDAEDFFSNVISTYKDNLRFFLPPPNPATSVLDEDSELLYVPRLIW